jgi:hypothetical protein
MNHELYGEVDPDMPWTYPWVLLSCHHQDGVPTVDITGIGDKCISCVDEALSKANAWGRDLPFCDVCDTGWATRVVRYPTLAYSLCETCYFECTYQGIRNTLLYKLGWTRVAPKAKSV